LIDNRGFDLNERHSTWIRFEIHRDSISESQIAKQGKIKCQRCHGSADSYGA